MFEDPFHCRVGLGCLTRSLDLHNTGLPGDAHPERYPAVQPFYQERQGAGPRTHPQGEEARAAVQALLPMGEAGPEGVFDFDVMLLGAKEKEQGVNRIRCKVREDGVASHYTYMHTQCMHGHVCSGRTTKERNARTRFAIRKCA